MNPRIALCCGFHDNLFLGTYVLLARHLFLFSFLSVLLAGCLVYLKTVCFFFCFAIFYRLQTLLKLVPQYWNSNTYYCFIHCSIIISMEFWKTNANWTIHLLKNWHLIRLLHFSHKWLNFAVVFKRQIEWLRFSKR